MTPFYHAIQLPLFATSKVCPDCEKEKVFEDFYKNRACKDGLTTYCKICTKVRVERYRTTHDEQYRASYRLYNRKYREMHPEYQKEYTATHREQYRGYHAKHETKNRDKRIEMRSTPDYIEKRRAYGSRWAKENRMKLRQRDMRRNAREKGATLGEVNYERILERDGLWCYICGKDIDPTIKNRQSASLTFDHEKPLAGIGERQGTHTEDNIHPAHNCCNSRKGTMLLSEMTPYQRRGPI